MQHIFDPLSRNIGYDPEVMAAQRTLEATYLPTELDYGEGFSGGQNLSTDLGQEAWFTSGLFGLMLSKFADEDSQKEWFVQRNAIDYSHKGLDRRIEAYRKVGETRDFTQQEADLIKEMISRRDLIEEDLEFVYENFGGDLDAIIDDKGKSFNDRWGVEGDEEAGLLDLLALFKDNPSYTGGVITAEVIKDLPFLGIAKLLGIAHKGLKLSTIVNNVSAKLAGIESWLSSQFPFDVVDEVKKGAFGADCVQTIHTRDVANCGVICYESKNTKSWSDGWIAKLKQDMLKVNADLGVLVSSVYPKDMRRMGFVDGIWVCSLDEFKGSSALLRDTLIRVHQTAKKEENRSDKINRLYDYMTGNEFSMQLKSIVDGFMKMQEELDKEKRSLMASWKRRQKTIDGVLANTTEMYGALQGIAGDSVITHIDALELEAPDK